MVSLELASWPLGIPENGAVALHTVAVAAQALPHVEYMRSSQQLPGMEGGAGACLAIRRRAVWL